MNSTVVEKLKAKNAIVGQEIRIDNLYFQPDPAAPSPTEPIITALQPPRTFINRPVEFQAASDSLLNDEPTVLQGNGGFGKTVLAQAICHDPAISTHFRDGVLWVQVGQAPNLMTLLHSQTRLLDPDQPLINDLSAASTRFKQLLGQRNMLLVLDDVWEVPHAQLFLPANRPAACLLTTRRLDLATRLQATGITIGLLHQEEATALLLKWLTVPPNVPKAFESLVAYLGHWPLLLELAAAYLRELTEVDGVSLEQALGELWDQLDAYGFTALDREDEGHRNQAISVSLNLSLRRLGPLRDRYLELAIFPPDVEISYEVVARLWASTAEFDGHTTRKAFLTMQRLSLFERYEPATKHIRLHEVMRDYLHQQLAERLPLTHGRFLDHTWRQLQHQAPRAESWADLPASESYLWQQLAYHLIHADRPLELIETVRQLPYLAAKTFHSSAHAAEQDILLAETYLRHRVDLDCVAPELPVLRRVFANAEPLLDRCDTLNQLTVALYSRLHHLTELKYLTRVLTDSLQPPYFIPAHPLPSLPHAALLRTFSGHALAVTACAFSPDGQRIVSASLDGTLKLWLADTGQPLLSLRGHNGPLTTCTYSPQGDYLLSASWDRTIKIWDAGNGDLLKTLSGHRDRVWSAAFHPHQPWVISAADDGTVKMWDVDHQHCMFTLNGHDGPVQHVAFSPDGQTCLSTSQDGTVRLWDARTGAVLYRYEAHDQSVLCAAYHPTLGLIASVSADRTVRLWEAENGETIHTLTGHAHEVLACAFSPDGDTLLTAGKDRTLKLWQVETGELVTTVLGHTDWVRGCAFAPDGRYMISVGGDKTLKVWDSWAKAEQRMTIGHTATVHACALSADGRHLFSVADDGLLKVWDALHGTELLSLQGHHSRPVHGCAVHPRGGRVASVGWDRGLMLWDVTVTDLQAIQNLEGRENTQLSRPGHLRLSGHNTGLECCAFSLDGRILASGGMDHNLQLWLAATGDRLMTLTGHDGTVLDCAFAPESGLLLSASADHTLKLWDVATGEVMLTLVGHGRSVNSGRFSRDGMYIVSAADDNTIRVWDSVSGYCYRTLTGHTNWVSKAVFSPDGRYILSVSVDATLRLWQTDSGQCLTSMVVDGPLYDGVFALDGRGVVVVGKGGVHFFQLVL